MAGTRMAGTRRAGLALAGVLAAGLAVRPAPRSRRDLNGRGGHGGHADVRQP